MREAKRELGIDDNDGDAAAKKAKVSEISFDPADYDDDEDDGEEPKPHET
jgi:hypothetical protein